ncbi:uncharacterized protein MYCFIDRAFT_86937 [Pseudocercospora fijiensis CIRAD86]|uniref:Uncharacterized protein n=1 Tax=Pseudocercospora fijiensis (strain CIRAD86) TaxID=383855 RepID=M3A2J8_PSEFD|nr:uncharacterized protein MYCFIDRAFT_86937 [Pseudocercospora fijiensis CIRAD86]EME78616.1 hypothetical protein MYCFIDRAFT_86937 [Pseudocercospora fijiensis CIRAD86]
MPIWPFRRRRRASSNNPSATAIEQHPLALAEKGNPPSMSTLTHSPGPRSATATPPIPRRNSRRNSKRGRPRPASEAQSPASQHRNDPSNKENVPPLSSASREDITALPFQQRLDQSPHLRPVDLEKPPIPYNFRPHSMSQTSVQRQDSLAKLQKSQTRQSKRSTADYGAPTRRFSGRSKRKDDTLREEEIRAMTAPIPIPKRPGDGPLRRDSKKIRGLNGDSRVSLPPEGSIHSSMSGIVEQRGWEVGSFAAIFSPRPAVRLSGLPQYVSNSLPPSSSGFLYRIDSLRASEKAPANQDGRERRKRRTVGNEADDLGASDIRAIMERDAKRREKRQQERQETLERKLKAKAEGRDRADSGRKRRPSEERRRVEQARIRAEEQLQARGVLTPPSDVHPALRGTHPEPAGLGIDQTEELQASQLETVQPAAPQPEPENPFTDAAEVPPASPQPGDVPAEARPTTAESPAEEPFLGTAQAVRMSQANTPPLSPIYGQRAMSSASQLAEALRHESISQQSMADLAPPPRIPVERRSSDPPQAPQERRTGTWANIFRRGGTFRKSVAEPKEPAQSSFSNTSRESMRNQPLPAHFVGTDPPRPGTYLSKSGTPVRTQSKFREDLPGMPISPPDSRTQSPDVATSAAAAAAFRAPIKSVPLDIPVKKQRDAEGDVIMGNRNDTPVSQNLRSRHQMSGSLASIDSEGSWLASGSLKRQSHQSALSKSFAKKNAEFTASYEELGVDKDAEYLSRNTSSRGRGLNSQEEESEEETQPDPSPGEPFTVHESMRRKPTLVEHDPRLRSREGLVQEFSAQEAVEMPYERFEHADDSDESEPESPQAQIERATSVKTGGRHSRQFSSGSAKLLNVPRNRASFDVSSDVSREQTPPPHPPIHESQKDE